MYRARNHKQSLMLALSAVAIIAAGCSDNGPLGPSADVATDQTQVDTSGGSDRQPQPAEGLNNASGGDLRVVTEASLANVHVLPGLSIGPVARLTTAWHQVDAKTLPIPFDSSVLLAVAVESGVSVEWTNAREVARDANYSEAICQVLGKGGQSIRVDIRRDGSIESHTCQLKGVNVNPWDVRLSAAIVVPAAEAFTSGPSGGTPVTERSNFFRTTPGRPLAVHVDASPAVFASLMEWRIDGEASFLGADMSFDFQDLGLHNIAIGPPGRARTLTIQTYQLDQQDDQNGGDRLPNVPNP